MRRPSKQVKEIRTRLYLDVDEVRYRIFEVLYENGSEETYKCKLPEYFETEE